MACMHAHCRGVHSRQQVQELGDECLPNSATAKLSSSRPARSVPDSRLAPAPAELSLGLAAGALQAGRQAGRQHRWHSNFGEGTGAAVLGILHQPTAPVLKQGARSHLAAADRGAHRASSYCTRKYPYCWALTLIQAPLSLLHGAAGGREGRGQAAWTRWMAYCDEHYFWICACWREQGESKTQQRRCQLQAPVPCQQGLAAARTYLSVSSGAPAAGPSAPQPCSWVHCRRCGSSLVT
jgi:hypothetical protein